MNYIANHILMGMCTGDHIVEYTEKYTEEYTDDYLDRCFDDHIVKY